MLELTTNLPVTVNAGEANIRAHVALNEQTIASVGALTTTEVVEIPGSIDVTVDTATTRSTSKNH